MSELASVDRAGPVATVTLRRADKRNALSRALIADLTAAFTQVRDDAAVRVVILTGDGPAFCAGMDLGELRDTLTAGPEIVWDDAVKLAALFDLIYTLPKPTVAAVNGPAVAGGAGLVSVCDLAVAAPAATFGYPEVKRGIVAALVLPHLLRLVGERAARQLLLTGELISAWEAHRVGLITAVADGEPMLAAAHRLAAQCAAGGPEALAATKRLLHTFSRQALSVEELAKESAAPRLGAECRAGLTAFFNQQPPPWT